MPPLSPSPAILPPHQTPQGQKLRTIGGMGFGGGAAAGGLGRRGRRGRGLAISGTGTGGGAGAMGPACRGEDSTAYNGPSHAVKGATVSWVVGAAVGVVGAAVPPLMVGGGEGAGVGVLVSGRRAKSPPVGLK